MRHMATNAKEARAFDTCAEHTMRLLAHSAPITLEQGVLTSPHTAHLLQYE